MYVLKPGEIKVSTLITEPKWSFRQIKIKNQTKTNTFVINRLCQKIDDLLGTYLSFVLCVF